MSRRAVCVRTVVRGLTTPSFALALFVVGSPRSTHGSCFFCRAGQKEGIPGKYFSAFLILQSAPVRATRILTRVVQTGGGAKQLGVH